MIDLVSYETFVAASATLILDPGPAQALVLANTLVSGRGAGAFTAIGLNIGTMFHASAAALGLSALLATSAPTFPVAKYVGAAYLIYLGIQAPSCSHLDYGWQRRNSGVCSGRQVPSGAQLASPSVRWETPAKLFPHTANAARPDCGPRNK